MPDLPSTIKHPEGFINSPAAGFDGLFNWEWMRGLFPRGIMPMDFDGVVELGGWFFVFETKDPGVSVPQGQSYTLKRLPEMFVLFFIVGKDSPRRMRIMHHGQWVTDWFDGVDAISSVIRDYAAWAERNPFPQLDSVAGNQPRLMTLTESANAFWKSQGWTP